MNIQNDHIFKKYQSRDGRKVEVLTTIGPDKDHPVVVAYGTEVDGYTYDSVTNEGREFGMSIQGDRMNIETENDLVEVNEITLKQTFIWKGTIEDLQDHLGAPSLPTFFNGVTVSEFREVIE